MSGSDKLASYPAARDRAQQKADVTGRDVGLEWFEYAREWFEMILPDPANRYGHELLVEVVRPGGGGYEAALDELFERAEVEDRDPARLARDARWLARALRYYETSVWARDRVCELEALALRADRERSRREARGK